MHVRPLPGVEGQRLLELLMGAESRLTNARASSPYAIDTFNAYLVWSNQEVHMFANSVTPASLDALVTTPRYWALQALDPATKGNSLGSLVNLEIDEQLKTLQAAQSQIRAQMSIHDGVDLLLVPDTNAYLQSPLRFDEVRWHQLATDGQTRVRIAVPLLVIDEIDRAKKRTDKVVEGSRESIRDRARTTLRTFEGLFDDPTVPAVLRESTADMAEVSVVVLMDTPGHVRLPDADNEIVDQARALADLSGKPTSVVTRDTGMRLRARAAKLTVVEIPEG